MGGKLVGANFYAFCNYAKEVEFEPPGVATIFFSDIQSDTLNYHTPRRTLTLTFHLYILFPSRLFLLMLTANKWRRAKVDHPLRAEGLSWEFEIYFFSLSHLSTLIN